MPEVSQLLQFGQESDDLRLGLAEFRLRPHDFPLTDKIVLLYCCK
jgi:hypothetical protein